MTHKSASPAHAEPLESPCNFLVPQPASLELQPGYYGYLSTWDLSVITLNSCAPAEVHTQLQCELPEQGFELLITAHKISLHYQNANSLMYALHALKQLRQAFPDRLPCMSIQDQPSYPDRGILLDISRDKVPTLVHLKRLIDLWASLRINQLQLYTEHTFAWQQHRTVWQDKSPMTAQDIQQIDAYCQQRGITLIANMATFGHMERWLAHAEYQHLAEQTTGFYDQRGDFRPFSFGLNPQSQDCVSFVSELMDELTPNFTSSIININFDETMDLGVDASKSACEASSKGQVYVDYLNKILALTEAKQLHTQIFSDMLFHYPDILSQLPSNLTLLNWGYEADHPYDKEHQLLQQTGLPYQVVVSTCCFASISGRWQNAKSHMLTAARSGLNYGASGYHVSEWGDMGHAQQDIFPYSGYIYGAALAWAPEQNQTLDVQHWLQYLACDGDADVAFWALRLQDIYLDLGIETPNACFLGPLLFDQRFRRHLRRSTNLTTEGFAKAAQVLQTCLAQVNSDNPSQLQQQIRFTAALLLHGVHLGQALLANNSRDVEDLSTASKAQLLAEILPLLSQYRALWLVHNREGGLQDSQSKLQVLVDLYQN
ncbi:family 20 glycosylhydrolase [Motilimonas pumila]|nr:family 20 glycosylhydrolase [Motilimonas pumila]